jgi:cysteine desulfurase
MSFIYLDNNASTPMLPAVWEAMQPYFFEQAGNPASSHSAGRQARRGLEDARERLAHLLDAHPQEVIFTSGATEANNLAIFGLCGREPGQVITSAIEHPCVSGPIEELARTGWTVCHLPVNPEGIIDPDAVVIRPDTRLLAVMLANHETGAMQPVPSLGHKIDGGVPFHCDAAAAAGKVPISFHNLRVSSLTISAHKFHGPKGVGALLVKREAKLHPLHHGGHQQAGKRPGTEPVPLVVGMAVALELAMASLEENSRRVCQLRELFLSRLKAGAAPIIVNGPNGGGIPHTVNVSFPGCRADTLLMKLDLEGIACSTGSACSSGSLLPSPVLKAMGIGDAVLLSAIRFSLSPLLCQEVIEDAAIRICRSVNMLRKN